MIEPVKTAILSVQRIPQINSELAGEFTLKPVHTSLGLITATSDHSLYAALDEATKKSEAEVLYTRSFYGGSKYSSGPFSGEVMGVFAGENPDIVDDALRAAIYYINEKAWFYSVPSRSDLIFFPHVIGSIGTFLSKETGLPEGEAIAYLMAPPIEAMVAFDYALKNSDTRLVKFYKPVTPTNFSGGYLTGTISDCEAAAEAFTEKIIRVSENPVDFFV